MTAIAIMPDDHDAAGLRRAASCSRDAGAARRLLALAMVLEGSSRAEAARSAGMDRQTLRDWVHRYNAKGLAGLSDRPQAGRPACLLTVEQEAAVAELVRHGPDPAEHGVVRWRLCDLGHWLWQEFRVSVSVQTLSRELRAMGYRRLSARPRHHAQAEGAIEAFKKTSLPRWRASRRTKAAILAR